MFRKTLILILSVFVCAFQSVRGQGVSNETLGRAFDQVIEEVETELRGSSELKGLRIVVLPFGDSKYSFLAPRLKNAATRAGLHVLEERQSPILEAIYKEIEWHERKADILSSDHIAKFGRLQGAGCILYGYVRNADVNPTRAYVELELHAANIATRQHIWGGTFVARCYADPKLIGQTTLTPSMRKLLLEAFETAKTSIAKANLGSVKTINVVPLAGDVGDYVTSLAIQLVTGKQVAKYDGFPTLSDARLALRSKPDEAIMYGAVRDVHVGGCVQSLAPDGQSKNITCRMSASIQLHIEDTSGRILWSDTIELDKAMSEKCYLTPEEQTKYKENMHLLWFRNQKLVFEREEANAKIKLNSLLRIQKLEYAALDIAHDKWLKENKQTMEKELAAFHRKLEELSRAGKLDSIEFQNALRELSQKMQKQQREYEIQMENVKQRQQLDLQGLEGSRLMLLKEFDVAQHRRDEEIRTLNQDIERQRKQLLQRAENLAAELDSARKKHDAALAAARKDHEAAMKKRVEEFELKIGELVAENKALMQAQFFKYFWVALGTVIVFVFVIIILRLCWSHTHIG